ncbi:MAG: potassium channel family protein [bacterium]
MNNILFLIFRRMRYPLVTLIVVYSISILGLVLIPGQDADGNPWRMSIFHAFYFVSYMSTTIGFGELPHAFTDAQRMWVTVTIYASVIAWLYAIGTILALLQDKVFHQFLVERRFARRVKRLREPFILVCGYGETGGALVRALTERGQHVVVVDNDIDRINLIKLQNLKDSVPSLCGDARLPEHLLEAGLEHGCCEAVVALTDENETNLKIAVTAKLLHPEIKVICRADSHDIEANMASFGTDYIVDPYDTFARYYSTALQSPCLYLMHRWLTGESQSRLPDPIYPPAKGHWIVCGYGRFGKPLYERLRKEGVPVTVIEARPDLTGVPEGGVVEGRGTEAVTLIKAGIETASGLVAGTDDDVNNLSIIMTAREINPDIFVVVRQNRKQNDSIIHAVDADMVMHPSSIIADRIRVLLATPMLYQFLGRATSKEDSWACELVSRISGLVSSRVPEVMELEISSSKACSVVEATRAGKPVTIGYLLRDPLDRDESLRCIPLLIIHAGEKTLLPANDQVLEEGDRLLFCGSKGALSRLGWTVCHDYTLEYVLTGESPARSWLWKKFSQAD